EVVRGQADPAIVALVDELLAQPGPFAQAAGLEILGRMGPAPESHPAADRAADVRSRLSAGDAGVRAAALGAVRSFPKLWAEEPVRAAIKAGLADADPKARVAALRLALEPAAKIAESAIRKALDDPAPAARIVLLERMVSE